MSTFRPTALAALMALSSACLSNDAEEFADQIFQQNLALWEATGPSTYSFVVARACGGGNCGPSVNILVEVDNGVVVARTYESSGLPLEAEWAPDYPTLRGLFDIASQAKAKHPIAFSVGYDTTWGYINFLQVDISGSTNSDNFAYAVVAFTPGPTPG